MEFTHQVAYKALGMARPSKLHEMHIRKAEGGYIVKHDHRDSTGRHSHSTHHVLHNMDALKGHIQQHMGDNPQEELAEIG